MATCCQCHWHPAAPFTLPAEAVLENLYPRLRYPVTVPAVAFWWLKRFLPIRAMDWVLMRTSCGGKH